MAKISKQELKEDEVHDLTVHLFQWFLKNQVTIYIVIGVIAAFYLGRIAYNTSQHNSLMALNSEYGTLFNSFQKASRNDDLDARKTELEEIKSKFEAFAASHSGEPIGAQAGFLVANIAFELEDYDAAIAEYQQFHDNASKPEQKAAALLGIADSLQNQAFRNPDQQKDLIVQSLEKYQAAYDAAPNNYIGYHALMQKASVLGRSPETRNDAIEIYEKVIADRPSLEAVIVEEPDLENVGIREKNQFEQMFEALTFQSFEKTAQYKIDNLKSLM